MAQSHMLVSKRGTYFPLTQRLPGTRVLERTSRYYEFTNKFLVIDGLVSSPPSLSLCVSQFSVSVLVSVSLSFVETLPDFSVILLL